LRGALELHLSHTFTMWLKVMHDAEYLQKRKERLLTFEDDCWTLMSQVETWSFAREGKVKHESEEAFSSESRENKRQQLKSRYNTEIY